MLRLLNLLKLLLAVNVFALLATTIGITGGFARLARPDAALNTSTQETPNTAGRNDFRTRAFTALYAAQLNPIRGYLRARLQDTSHTDDLTAEVFTRAWLKLDFSAAPESAISWLYTTARNLAVDHQRRLRPTLNLDALAPEDHPLSAPLEEHVTDSERSTQINTVLSALELREQQVIALRFVAGLPHRQIASTVGTTEGNAAKIQHRALQKLRAQLTGDFGSQFERHSDSHIVA